MKKVILALTIGFASSLGFAQNPDTSAAVRRFSLENCLSYAFGNSYTRQSMKLSEDAMGVVYDQSKMERLPNVSASAKESFTHTGSRSSWDGTYGVSASLPLYQGGSISNAIEQNKLAMEQAAYQTSQYENTLVIQILQAFLNVLGNEELLKYQHVVVEASEEQLKQGREQFRVGAILESDYLLLEAQYANDINNIADTQIARDNSVLTLKSLLSMAPTEELQVIYPDTAALTNMSEMPTLDNVLNRAVNTLPDLKISEYNVSIANLNIKLAKSGYMPSLSLYGSIGTGHPDGYNSFGTQLSNSLNEQIGLSLSIPIYNNSRTKSKVKRGQIALQQAELEKKQTELDVMQNVAVEYQDVVSSYNKYKTTNIRQHAYLKTFEAYRVQFNAGAITAVDLLQQQNNYISALNDFIQSKYSFMLKRKILDVYMAVPITM
ncbi:MAG: TolC family protein [Prevotellaceae bacterium]|jgi:outer membrane protein|nr:TolC family protein [Prevotellaceae bacterium]